MTKANFKRLCGRLLFAGELLLCVWVYFYGAYGFVQLTALREECAQIAAQKQEKAACVKDLQERIIAWNVHSFEKEKLAREQLQMARKDEIIYLIS
jgi:cell division protein FtsB